MNKRMPFEEFLNTHKTFKAALAEAVHRYFYDHCFNPYTDKMADDEEAKQFFDLRQTMHCELPNWRFLLKKNTERYLAWEDTKALVIDSKPKNPICFKLHLLIDSI